MALRLTSPTFSSFPIYPPHRSKSSPTSSLFQFRQSKALTRTLNQTLAVLNRRRFTAARASVPKQQEQKVSIDEEKKGDEWGKVTAVLFDMDGVLCDSEEPSRMAGVDVFAEMGVSVTTEDFVSFMGTGEANFLGGVATVKGVTDFNPEKAKKRFFEIYLDKYAKPNSGIGFPGAFDLVMQCKNCGLKVAVASSADRIKVDANLAAAGLPISVFDVIVSADAFENLKPAPDIFLAASKKLNVHPSECLVIEDAFAGVQAAKAAQMRCIAVTTTLSQEKMQQAGPSMIRKNIGDIKIDDVLNGGHPNAYNQAVERSYNNSLEHTSSDKMNENVSTERVQHINVRVQDINVNREELTVLGGFQCSRRDILRYGSLGVAISCLLFTVTNWKAMQYASFKGVFNLISGVQSPIFGQNKEEPRSSRVKQLRKYLSDLEDRGSASDVPEFPSKLDWLNSAPLQFHRNLKGKVVVLDFWTYCCINCMHVLPDLEYLENKYADKPFTVVGVHSAKFDNEKDLEAIRNAVLRYNVTHPVVNDGDMYLWRELGVSSWPTFVVVGPNGKLIAQISGEGHRKDLDELVDAALQFYGERKLLENTPIPLALEKNNDRRLISSPLKFPGKLAIDVLNNRLFISDSNHNRIVVTDLEGNFVIQVGSSGEEGLVDGSFDNASFNRPQGLAYNPKKNILYVADTENHALREIDFVNETVRTLAGNGIKGSDYKGGEKGTIQVLNSPWDVCYNPLNEVVYIAMAGQHQIWEHNVADEITRAFSGDGFERNLNGSSSATTSFAQPSGISLSSDLQEVYVADSESSSIRALDLKTGGSRLLAGGDPYFPENLFKYGDHDGIGSDALLQHPLGIVCGKDGQIYIADSYNHKIKKLDPTSRKVTTIAGTGNSGYKDGMPQSAQFFEPSGIIEAGSGRFLIADTNNSVIRCLDLNEKGAVLSTLELKDVQPLSSKPKLFRRLSRRLSADTIIISSNVGSATEGYLYLAVSVPGGYHFSKEAQSKFDVEVDPTDAAKIEPSNGLINSDGSASLYFKRISSSPATGRINCKVYYCKEDEICLYQSLAFNVSFDQEVQESKPAEISLAYNIAPKVTSAAASGARGRIARVFRVDEFDDEEIEIGPTLD